MEATERVADKRGISSAKKRERMNRNWFFFFISPWLIGFLGLTIGPMIYELHELGLDDPDEVHRDSELCQSVQRSHLSHINAKHLPVRSNQCPSESATVAGNGLLTELPPQGHAVLPDIVLSARYCPGSCQYHPVHEHLGD